MYKSIIKQSLADASWLYFLLSLRTRPYLLGCEQKNVLSFFNLKETNKKYLVLKMHFILHLELEYLDFILISLRAEILKQFEQEIKEQFSYLPLTLP